jgi:hypothetical protein
VVVDRTPGTQEITGVVVESVDPGIDFAYTRIANNLQGRLARGAVLCEGDDGGTFVLMQGRFF